MGRVPRFLQPICLFRVLRSQQRLSFSLKRARKGYEGEACGTCGNFTLVRNGTCLKCETCGGTTGCS